MIAGLFFGRLISVVSWSLRRNKQNYWNAGLYKKWNWLWNYFYFYDIL